MEQSCIRRKIGLSRKSLASVEAQGAAKAWKLALARSARDTIGLELRLIALRQNRSSLTELLDQPSERSLIAILEGPKDGLGLLVISPEILAGIVEMQMIGRECPIFCVTGIWSMLPERSKDDDDIQGITGRAFEGLRAA